MSDAADYIAEAAQGVKQAKARPPKASKPRKKAADEIADTVYAELRAKGITVDPAIVDVTEARRILAAAFGVSFTPPYTYLHRSGSRARSPLFSSTEPNYDTIEAICHFMSTEGTLRRALHELPGMPGPEVFYAWMRSDERAATLYAHAREAAAERMADEIEDAADNLMRDPCPTRERIAAALGAIDAKKWKASKLGPAVYGDFRSARLAEAADGFINLLERVEEARRRQVEEGRQAKLAGPIIDVEPAEKVAS